jgi:2-polyprenyl-6-methoxyphenol hydroxylase-like FAD-dependent oxidoreductase
VVAPASEPDGRGDAAVTIWRPGLVLLERLGLRRPVERAATRLDALACLGAGDRFRTDAEGSPALLSIDRDHLETIFGRHVFARLRTVETPVIAVDQASSHVTVTFADSVRERFDLVVTSAGALLPAPTDPKGGDPVHVWEFEWPDGVSAPALPTEGWHERFAAFTTPAGDRTVVELLAAGEVPQTAVLDRETLGARFGAVLPGGGELFDVLTPSSLSYRRAAPQPRESRVVGRTALVGPAVRPSGPANPLTAALAVEDAWVLADALAYGPESVPAALDAYRRRRRRRDARIDADGPAGRCGPRRARWPALDRLADARALGFGHVLGDEIPALARVEPAEL